MIRLVHVSRFFQEGKSRKDALKDINLSLPEKGLVFLLGKSGAGKTTLLNAIGGIDSYEGEIDYGSLPLTSKNIEQERNRLIGYVFQDFALDSKSTVFENIRQGLIIGNIYDEKEQKERIAQALESVHLSFFQRRRASALSLGQKQRVAIARALVLRPRILLCDEPTGSLDEQNGLSILELLKEISKETLVICATHDEANARKLGDMLIYLADGTIERIEGKNEEDELPSPETEIVKQHVDFREQEKVLFHGRMSRKGNTFLAIVSLILAILFPILMGETIQTRDRILQEIGQQEHDPASEILVTPSGREELLEILMDQEDGVLAMRDANVFGLLSTPESFVGSNAYKNLENGECVVEDSVLSPLEKDNPFGADNKMTFSAYDEKGEKREYRIVGTTEKSSALFLGGLDFCGALKFRLWNKVVAPELAFIFQDCEIQRVSRTDAPVAFASKALREALLAFSDVELINTIDLSYKGTDSISPQESEKKVLYLQDDYEVDNGFSFLSRLLFMNPILPLTAFGEKEDYSGIQTQDTYTCQDGEIGFYLSKSLYDSWDGEEEIDGLVLNLSNSTWKFVVKGYFTAEEERVPFLLSENAVPYYCLLCDENSMFANTSILVQDVEESLSKLRERFPNSRFVSFEEDFQTRLNGTTIWNIPFVILLLVSLLALVLYALLFHARLIEDRPLLAMYRLSGLSRSRILFHYFFFLARQVILFFFVPYLVMIGIFSFSSLQFPLSIVLGFPVLALLFVLLSSFVPLAIGIYANPRSFFLKRKKD